MRGNYYENKAFLMGRLEAEFEFDYMENEEKIYSSALLITRKSGIVDRVPVTITEKEWSSMQSLMGYLEDWSKYKLRVEGIFLNNPFTGYRPKVSVRILNFSWEDNCFEDVNRLEFTGKICTAPKFRETPKGRKICDFVVCTENENNSMSYIHSIAWEKYAYLIRNLKIGNKITIEARLQSRKYKKYLDNSRFEYREVYEASVLTVSL